MFVFDLDLTVIDSRHRQATLPNGDLDLAHWFENNTPDLIAQDLLMPLAEYWKKVFNEGATIAIVTSRRFQSADFEFLFDNGLRYHFLLSRKAGDMRADGVYKFDRLHELKNRSGVAFERMTYFEDNQSCIKVGRNLGMTVIEANFANSEFLRKVA